MFDICYCIFYLLVTAVGEVPLRWYKDEDHIGYDRRGQKLQKKAQKDKLEALLAKNDLPHQWRTIYDEYNDEEITLSKEEIELLQRIRQGRFPHIEVDFDPTYAFECCKLGLG